MRAPLSTAEAVPLFVCVGLAAVAVMQLAAPSRTPLPPPSRVEAAPVVLAAPPPVAPFAAILAAPIFAPDRRAAGSAGTGALSAGLDSYRVLGEATGRGFATALVQGPYGGPRSLSPGQELEGWRLVAIGSGRLVFAKGRARKTLAVGGPAARSAKAAPADAESTS